MEEDMDANTAEMEENGEEREGICSKGKGQVPIILRAEELSEHCNLPANLPTRGKKEVYPDGSERQQQKLQRIYNQQDKLLQEERVVKVNRVAVGEWNQSKQLVEVKVEKGKFWQTMGYNANGKKYLYPEEGLFLLEMNIMELRYGKVPISVQQAYELMIPFQFSLEHYQVYCHLMRLGYITTRHKESDITDYEYRINLDQFRHRQKQAYKKVQGWFQQMNETTSVAQQDVIVSDVDSGRDVKSNKSSGSMSFHGSGVSGKGVEGMSVSSSVNGQCLPGSGVSTDSSADNDDASSVYSDGPVSPKKDRIGSEVPSVNLLEFHRKHTSDGSTVSSPCMKKLIPSNGSGSNEQKKVKAVSADSIQKIKKSRKRKIVNSDEELGKKIEAISGTKRKAVATEMSDLTETQKDRLLLGQKSAQDIIMKEKEPDQKESVKMRGKIDKNTSKDDSGKETASRRSSDGSIKDFTQKTKETTSCDEAIMESMSEHCQERSDCGKTTENQDKSFRAKSSDLGTDLSLSPSSIDIDDVLGILSPSSPRNDSILDDGNREGKYTPWNFSQISLPNLAENRHKLGLPMPEYLPGSIASIAKEQDNKKADTTEESAVAVAQTDMIQELAKVSQLLKASSELMQSTSMILGTEDKDAGSEKKVNVPAISTQNIENVRRLFPSKPEAKNWGEYKRLTNNVDKLTGITDLVQSPVAHLWQGEVQPLVRPSDAVSTSYVLHKLQIIQSANLTSQHVRWPYSSNTAEDSRIAFDVYQPDTGYKKSKPGQPGFKVVVSSVKDPVPNLATQAYLLRQASPVRLLWAVVDTNGDMAFYSLQDVEVPVDITVGW